MENHKLAADEARRNAQHDFIKTRVESDVNTELATHVDQAKDSGAKQMDRVAIDLRRKAIDEVVDSEREVGRARVLARLAQIIDAVFYIIYALLAARLLLALIAARPGAGFVKFIHTLTDPLYGPFRGIVASPSVEGGFTLAGPIVVAILAYAVLHVGIRGFMRLVVQRKTEI